MGHLPIQRECLKMVDRYTDKIIDMFIAEYTPQEVCAQLGLCDPPKIEQIENNIIVRFPTNDIQATPGCILCQFAIQIIEKEILTNRSMDMVEHAVEMLCSIMPSSIADECTDFVQKYGDQIIHLIVVAEMNPEMVCDALMLCLASENTWGEYCRLGCFKFS